MKWEWLKGEMLMNPSFYYYHTVHSVVCIPKYITQGANKYDLRVTWSWWPDWGDLIICFRFRFFIHQNYSFDWGHFIIIWFWLFDDLIVGVCGCILFLSSCIADDMKNSKTTRVDSSWKVFMQLWWLACWGHSLTCRKTDGTCSSFQLAMVKTTVCKWDLSFVW